MWCSRGPAGKPNVHPERTCRDKAAGPSKANLLKAVSHGVCQCVRALFSYSVFCLFLNLCLCMCQRQWRCVLCLVLFVLFRFLSSAWVHVGLWLCASLFACSWVSVIIPVCWQSKRTEGSVYADLNPPYQNCHLEGTQRNKRYKKSMEKFIVM